MTDSNDKPAAFYEEKYGLSAPHSAVIEVVNHIQPGDALDLGCGRGRNSIYLQTRGFRVTAVDHSAKAIATLQEIIAAEEECRGIRTQLYDIATASIDEDYDLVASTVVMQFLPADSIEAVITNMQAHTKPGGINLIVAPISTETDPCPIDWPFTFGERELLGYYSTWTPIEYNENPGTFHRLDENGNPYRSRFATLIARK